MTRTLVFSALTLCSFSGCGTAASTDTTNEGLSSDTPQTDDFTWTSDNNGSSTSSAASTQNTPSASNTTSRGSSAITSGISPGGTLGDSTGGDTSDGNSTTAVNSATDDSSPATSEIETPSTREVATNSPPTNDSNGTPTSDASSSATTSSSDPSTSSDATNDGCEFSGNVSYRINNPESFPEDALQKLTGALDEAIYYYNCYSDLSHSLSINYKPSVPTAEGNVDGVISFGSDRNYMVVATVMHEIGHTMGVGYAPWSALIEDGKWIGPAVVEYMTNLPANERDSDEYSQRTFITCDAQHFWPYGLNQASEHRSEWSLINHVRIVAAMHQDKDALR